MSNLLSTRDTYEINHNYPKGPGEYGELSHREVNELKRKVSFRYFTTYVGIGMVVFSVLFSIVLLLIELMHYSLLDVVASTEFVVIFVNIWVALLAGGLYFNGTMKIRRVVNQKISLEDDKFVYSFCKKRATNRKIYEAHTGNFFEYTVYYRDVEEIYYDSNRKMYRIKLLGGVGRAYSNYIETVDKEVNNYEEFDMEEDHLDILNTFEDEDLFLKIGQRSSGSSIISQMEIKPVKIQVYEPVSVGISVFMFIFVLIIEFIFFGQML